MLVVVLVDSSSGRGIVVVVCGAASGGAVRCDRDMAEDQQQDQTDHDSTTPPLVLAHTSLAMANQSAGLAAFSLFLVYSVWTASCVLRDCGGGDEIGGGGGINKIMIIVAIGFVGRQAVENSCRHGGRRTDRHEGISLTSRGGTHLHRGLLVRILAHRGQLVVGLLVHAKRGSGAHEIVVVVLVVVLK